MVCAGALIAACSGLVDAPETQGGAQTSESNEAALAIRTAGREMRDGNLAEAARLLDAALADEPGNPAIWVAIARLRYRSGEHFGAIDAADRALELGPSFAPALLMRGQLVRDANGLSESLPWFEAAVAADPTHAEAVGEYAATLGDLGRFGEMLDAVERLSELDRENEQGLYLRAVLAARAGEFVLAKSLLDRSGWRGAGVPSAMLLDAVIDIQQGNADTAVETLAELSRLQPANRRVRDLYARALWEAGRDEKLVSELSEVVEGPDASAYLTMLAGRAHERLGDREAAAPLIAKAYSKPDTDWHSLSDTGAIGGALAPQTAQIRSAIASGDEASASGRAARFVDQFPQSADVLALAGDAAFANAEAAQAIENYSVSARVRKPWRLTQKLIVASRQTGEDNAANALLTRYALGDPRNADAIIALIEIARISEDWERVVELTDYAALLGSGQDPIVLNARLEAAQALGNDADAQRYESLLDAVRPPKLVRE
ncbi:hypothetical protein AUC45_01325 [Erythrobacter sp. YT30]|nr:hypothetical protein AUC45_01325 [Erythrobacter sp. YT30]